MKDSSISCGDFAEVFYHLRVCGPQIPEDSPTEQGEEFGLRQPDSNIHGLILKRFGIVMLGG